MNLLQVDRNLLLMPLQAVGGVVERRHTLPILSNVLLEVGGGKVSLTATDLEIQVAAEADASEAANSQATTVSAARIKPFGSLGDMAASFSCASRKATRRGNSFGRGNSLMSAETTLSGTRPTSFRSARRRGEDEARMKREPVTCAGT